MTWIAALFVCECLGFILRDSDARARLGRALAEGCYTGRRCDLYAILKSAGLGPEPMMLMCVRPLGAALEGIRKEGNNVGLRYKPASWLI